MTDQGRRCPRRHPALRPAACGLRAARIPPRPPVPSSRCCPAGPGRPCTASAAQQQAARVPQHAPGALRRWPGVGRSAQRAGRASPEPQERQERTSSVPGRAGPCRAPRACRCRRTGRAAALPDPAPNRRRRCMRGTPSRNAQCAAPARTAQGAMCAHAAVTPSGEWRANAAAHVVARYAGDRVRNHTRRARRYAGPLRATTGCRTAARSGTPPSGPAWRSQALHHVTPFPRSHSHPAQLHLCASDSRIR